MCTAQGSRNITNEGKRRYQLRHFIEGVLQRDAELGKDRHYLYASVEMNGREQQISSEQRTGVLERDAELGEDGAAEHGAQEHAEDGPPVEDVEDALVQRREAGPPALRLHKGNKLFEAMEVDDAGCPGCAGPAPRAGPPALRLRGRQRVVGVTGHRTQNNLTTLGVWKGLCGQMCSHM